jgi:hypothetical protein
MQSSFAPGITALWKGVAPAMARGVVYGGLRIGLYTPIKEAIGASDKSDSWALYKKIGAGVASGGFASAITNPAELV